MYNRSLIFLTLVLSIVVFVLVGGCTQTATPPQAAIDAANATADRVLQSINTGSYSDFSKDFSAPMLQGINESRFNSLRDDIMGNQGKYVSKSLMQSLVINGDNVFIYACQFEKGRLQFQFSINVTDMSTVDGLYYKPI